jgi:LuxR family quorum-sensing transcriptional regulator LasR
MYEEACGHGLRSGVTLPIHGAQGELGILCFVNDTKPGKCFQQEAHSMLPELSYLRDVIFETSLRFIKPSKSTEESPSITPRELECIKWCAAGKSSWEIAKIFHRSESAVNLHFTNLRRKFSVSSRQQVVVKAMRSGLIHP